MSCVAQSPANSSLVITGGWGGVEDEGRGEILQELYLNRGSCSRRGDEKGPAGAGGSWDGIFHVLEWSLL